MRCLVTGASGHLGSFLAKRLIKEGWTVAALVRRDSDLWRLSGVLDQVEVIRADLMDVASASSSINDARPEVVFHLAWSGVTSAFKNDRVQMTDNVSGSLKLFDIVRQAGCRHWIGVGSQAEYGPSENVLAEQTPLNPVTGYGAAKLAVGEKTRSLCDRYGIRHTWLRLLATYGPADDERHLIPSVVIQLLRGEHPKLTAGEQRWDYLYVEDAAEAVFQCAAKPAYGVFNLGSGESYRVREIIERIRDLVDPALHLDFGQLPYAPDQTMRLETSVEKLHQATGWQARTDLNEGLARTVDWYRKRTRGFN